MAAYVKEMPRTEVVEQTNHYIHAEASSALFGFVDDPSCCSMSATAASRPARSRGLVIPILG